MRKLGIALGAILGFGVGVAPAQADEAKTPVSASMLLTIMSSPKEPRESAYDRTIKDEGPASRSPWEGVAQPDGSVRYGSGPGSVTMTVRNPCPPGTVHYEPPELPGRRVKK